MIALDLPGLGKQQQQNYCSLDKKFDKNAPAVGDKIILI